MLLQQCDHVVSVHVVWLAPQGSGLSLVMYKMLECLFVVVVDSGDADPGCDSCVFGLTRRG